MLKKIKADMILTIVCTAFLLFMMCSIGIRFLTRQIIVKKLGISNAFTEVIFFDNKDMGILKAADNDTNQAVSAIDWSKLYPFDGIDIPEETAPVKESVFSVFTKRFKDKISSIESQIESYSTNLLIGYDTLTFFSKSYESFIGWNFTPFAEYNNLVRIGDNYFYETVAAKDVTESAESTIELSDYCDSKGIDFLYVQMPSKISKYDDTGISGITDFSNQNADAFLSMLNTAGINTFDLREEIHNDGLNHHDLFYETDHHWKAETGLWAAGKILGKMKNLGFDTNPAVLSPDRFDYVVYENWFLGSQGKKVTLAQATPEDISLIYPKEETLFHYIIPNLGIDETGDFSVTYMMKCINEKNYMGANPYGAYNYADEPLIQIENKLINRDCKVLIIHDSYANCVIPFMALDIKNIDSLDLRLFNGSVKSFIEDNNPDIVLVMYPANKPGSIDYSTHTAVFDFR